MFRVQDERRKNQRIEVRYFLLAYGQLIELICCRFHNEELSFKKSIIDMRSACTMLTNNEENRRPVRL